MIAEFGNLYKGIREGRKLSLSLVIHVHMLGHPCSYARRSKGLISSESRDESEIFTQLTSRMSSSDFPDVLSVSTKSQSSQGFGTVTYRLRSGKDKTYVS